MNKLKILLLAALSAGVYACSSSTEQQVTDANGVKITRSVVKDADEAKCTAKIAVDGMSCSKMCTGAIAGCLKKMDGVKVADVYFDEARKTDDFATVEFDDQKVTEKEMIAAIEKLNDGQYKVKSVEIVVSEVSYEKIEDKNEKKDEPVKSGSGKVTALNNICVAIPSVFSLLKRFTH